MNCLVLGSNSEIYQGMSPLLLKDGWTVNEWFREKSIHSSREWDLIICAVGRVAPVGFWAYQDPLEVEDCFQSNVILPLRLLYSVWEKRKPNASVCFMAGSNPNKIMKGYAPYNASKMALLKVCEQLDFETPDVKFFALGPGYVKTKIHKATLDANWPNERIARGDDGTPIYKIYDCLKWCLSQPKEVVGGRNICASDPYGPELAEKLKSNSSMYKLRRIE